MSGCSLSRLDEKQMAWTDHTIRITAGSPPKRARPNKHESIWGKEDRHN